MLQEESVGFLELLGSFILDNSSSLASTGSPVSSTPAPRPNATKHGYRLSRLRTKEAVTINDEEDTIVTGLDQNIAETAQRPTTVQSPISALERRIAEILMSKSSDFSTAAKALEDKSR